MGSMVMKAIYLAAESVALVSFVRVRYWRRWPAFFAYFAVSAALSVSAALPHDRTWFDRIWKPWEAAMLLLLGVSVAEAVCRQVKCEDLRYLRLALILTFITVVCLMARPLPPEALAAFVETRRYGRLGLAFVMATDGLFLWWLGIRLSREVRTQSWLLGLLLADAAWINLWYPPPAGWWHVFNTVYSIVMIGLLAGWAVSAWTTPAAPSWSSRPQGR